MTNKISQREYPSSVKDPFYERGDVKICLSPEDIIKESYSKAPLGRIRELGFVNTIPFSNKFLDMPSFMQGPPRRARFSEKND